MRFRMLGLVFLLGMHWVSLAHAGDPVTSLEFKIPSENGSSKFYSTVKFGEASTLTAAVNADNGFKILTRSMDAAPEGVTATGTYSFALAATLPENTYAFKLKGTYIEAGGGGGGAGTQPVGKAWNVAANVAVDKCTHEESGTSGANPAGTATFTSKDLGLSTYDVDVAIAGHTLKDVSDGLKSEGGGMFEFQLKWDPPKVKRSVTDVQCAECNQPCKRVEYMISEFKIVAEYQVTMPKWLQSTNAGPNAKGQWTAYYNALLGHENGHTDVLTTYIAADGKAIAGHLVEKVYWGVAHNVQRADDLTRSQMIKVDDVVKQIQDGLTDKENAYDTKTQHGANQNAVGGTDIPILNPEQPCGE